MAGEDAAAIERGLLTCPDRKFREAVDLLEQTRGQPGVANLLRAVRGRLARLRPKRRVNLRRLFYLPVEDQLVGDGEIGAEAAITRSAMESAWNFIRATAEPPAWSAFEHALLEANQEAQKISMLSARLWETAGEMIAHGLGETGGGELLQAKAELEQISVLLQGAVDLMALWQVLPPKPIRRLAPEHLEAINSFVTGRAQGDPKRAFILLRSVIARMAVPAVMVQPLAELSFGLAPADRHALTADIEALVIATLPRHLPVQSGTSADLLHRTKVVHDLVTAIAAAKDFTLTPGGTEALARMREHAEELVGGVIDEASDAVYRGIEEGVTATIDTRAATESGLLALRDCQSVANLGGINEKVAGSLGAIVEAVHGKVSQALGAREPDAEPMDDMASVSEQIYWGVRMLELAGNPDEAERVWRDGMAFINRGETAPVHAS